MDPIADLALQMTAIQTVIGFQVSDDWLNRLASFEQFHADLAELLLLSPMPDIDLGVIVIDAAIAQVGVDGSGGDAGVLHQDCCLLELLGQCVAIERVARKGARAHDQI